MDKVRALLGAANWPSTGRGLAKTTSATMPTSASVLAHSHGCCRRRRGVSAWSQKPEYHSTTTYHARGRASTGHQPTCHQKFRPRLTVFRSRLSSAEWLIKKTAPSSRLPVISHVPHADRPRRSALSHTV